MQDFHHHYHSKSPQLQLASVLAFSIVTLLIFLCLYAHHHFKHPKYCIENVSLKHFKHHKEEKTFFLETERSSFWIVQHSAARGMAETRIGNFLLTSFNNDQWAILQKHKK